VTAEVDSECAAAHLVLRHGFVRCPQLPRA